MKKQKLVVFSGAGISAESGLKTFRDNNGLWENHSIYDVATPEAWAKNPKLVLEFYNERRNQLRKAKPNLAHQLIAELENQFDVVIITQNIDDLHERAGSKKIIHLHGELLKGKSELFVEDTFYLSKSTIQIGDYCKRGHQIRPHVVWFGEEVPLMEKAIKELLDAEVFIVIGTSLNVYPAANLLGFTKTTCDCYVIDPSIPKNHEFINWTIINSKAVEGMKILTKKLSKKRSY